MKTECGDNYSKAMCKCPHHKMFGICVTLIGLAFLLGNLGILSAGFVSTAWPILVILVGLKKTFAGGCKCCGPAKEACDTDQKGCHN